MEALERKIRRQSILISCLIGFPCGLLAVLFVITLPGMITGEFLTTIVLYMLYGRAIAGLLISFVIALAFGGYLAFTDLRKNNTLLFTSFKYSASINLIIWSVFSLILIYENKLEESWIYLYPAFTFFLLGMTITPFTLGLLICYAIRQRIKKSLSHITSSECIENN